MDDAATNHDGGSKPDPKPPGKPPAKPIKTPPDQPGVPPDRTTPPFIEDPEPDKPKKIV